MKHKQIMEWGAKWHYPFLCIGQENDPVSPLVLRHGKASYRQLRSRAHKYMRDLTIRRIQRWNALIVEVVKAEVRAHAEVVPQEGHFQGQESLLGDRRIYEPQE